MVLSHDWQIVQCGASLIFSFLRSAFRLFHFRIVVGHCVESCPRVESHARIPFFTYLPGLFPGLFPVAVPRLFPAVPWLFPGCSPRTCPRAVPRSPLPLRVSSWSSHHHPRGCPMTHRFTRGISLLNRRTATARPPGRPGPKPPVGLVLPVHFLRRRSRGGHRIPLPRVSA